LNSFPLRMLSFKILYVFVKYSPLTPTQPVLSVSRYDSVGVVTRLQDEWPRSHISLQRKNKRFFCSLKHWDCLWAHPASYIMLGAVVWWLTLPPT
jgi:hypothetical protein